MVRCLGIGGAPKLTRPCKIFGFGLSLDDMRGDVPLRKSFANLEPRKRASGVARCRAVIALLEIGDHGEIRVAHQGVEIETIVARDQGNRLADIPTTSLDLAPNPVDIFDVLTSNPSKLTNIMVAAGPRF